MPNQRGHAAIIRHPRHTPMVHLIVTMFGVDGQPLGAPINGRTPMTEAHMNQFITSLSDVLDSGEAAHWLAERIHISVQPEGV